MSIQRQYKLLWSENFKYSDVNEFIKTWNFDLGDGADYGLVGWGNNELEYYLSESVNFSDGLEIEAKRVIDSSIDCYYGKAQWTSGKVHTANKVSFKYGKIEVKAKTPKGIGTWPAIWLLGNDLLSGNTWPYCGEIDILETTGANPRQIQGTIHGPNYFGEAGLTKIIQASEDLADGYHTFAIEWFPDKIEWYFDGDLYNTISKSNTDLTESHWPFNQEFYLILNLAIGGWFAGEVDEKLNQAIFNIDSINYYSIDGIGSINLN